MSVQQRALKTVANEMKSMADATILGMSMLSFTLTEMARFTNIHDSIYSLEHAIYALLSGNLTPDLIPVADVQSLLRAASNSLATWGFQLCVSSPTQVYELRNFQYARHRNDLYITLHIPYSSFPHIALYRTYFLPLPVNGQPGLTTTIKHFPEWFLRDAEGKFLAEFTGAASDIRHTIDINLVRFDFLNRPTCFSSIMADDVRGIHDMCDFTTQRREISPTVVNINKTAFVIHNLTDPTVICANSSHVVSSHICIPCVISLACHCLLHSAETRMLGPVDCDSHTNEPVKTLHASYNGAILQAFYQVEDVSLSTNHLVPPGDIMSLENLNLTFLEDHADDLLSNDQSLAYSLKKIEQSLNSSSPPILYSAADKILTQYIRELGERQSSFPDFQSVHTYVTCGAYVISLGLFLLILVLRRKYHALALILMSAPVTQRVSAIRIRTAQTYKPISPTQLSVIDYVQTLRYHDRVIISALFVVIAVLLALIVFVRKAFQRRAHLYLDVAGHNEVVQLKMARLVDASRLYSIRLPPDATRLILRSWCIVAVVIFDTPCWKLCHSKTHVETSLPRIVFVSPWKLRALRRILQSDSYIVRPVIFYSHEQLILQPSEPAVLSAAGSSVQH